jgi:hypothetical protein
MAAKSPVKKLIPVTCDPGGHLERRPLDSLTPFQGQLKDLDDARYAKLKASILAEGFMAPVFVWQDKILDGHQRTTVMAREGWDVEGGVPVVEIEAASEAEAARKLLKLTSAYGKPTTEGVFDFMQTHDLGLGDFADVDLPDFDEDALAVLFGEGGDEEPPTDDVPEPPATPVTRSGDLWHMGKHRVLCGDSTSAEAAEMAAECTSMVTDPPYGIGYAYRTHDDNSAEGNANLVTSVFAMAPKVRIWSPGLMNLARELHQEPDAKVMCWHKGFAARANGIGGASTWEPILAVEVKGGTLPNDYLRFDTDREPGLRDKHPCPKPVALYAHLIKHLAPPGVIYEPFLGSGTTLVAAHSEGRVCYGIEIDPAYVDVSVERWQGYTNQQAMLDGDGRTFAEVRAERLSGEDAPRAEAAG